MGRLLRGLAGGVALAVVGLLAAACGDTNTITDHAVIHILGDDCEQDELTALHMSTFGDELIGLRRLPDCYRPFPEDHSDAGFMRVWVSEYDDYNVDDGAVIHAHLKSSGKTQFSVPGRRPRINSNQRWMGALDISGEQAQWIDAGALDNARERLEHNRDKGRLGLGTFLPAREG